MRFGRGVGLLLLMSALLAAGCSSGDDSSALVVATVPPGAVPSEEPQYVAYGAAKSVPEATVRIETTGSFVPPASDSDIAVVGSGSGFVIDESGLIVTNNHVVAGAAIVNVFFDGSTTPTPGRVLATSECSDLAVVKIEGVDLQPLVWTNFVPETGAAVLAGGFPGGDAWLSLTEGIVSRVSVDGATPWASIDSLIQHDAALSPGNSGGPLVDVAGRVVGVNVASSSSGQYSVPTSIAHPVIDKLSQGIDVDSIGVNAQAVLDEQTNESGVWVSSVDPGSPADLAGVAPGDVITRMKGLRVAQDGTLSDYCGVLRSAGSDEIPIEVKRDGEVLAGSVNGEQLQPVLQVIDESEEQTTRLNDEIADVAPQGASYTEYMRVVDDTGHIAFDVPAEWADVATTEVTFAGASRPSITASTDVAALDMAAGSTYDVAGVAAIVFGVGAPMEATFDVVMASSPWQYDCTVSERKPFDDGTYRGVLGVYAGCNGSAMFLSTAIERIGSGRWMLVNMLAPTFAEVEVYARVLETFEFTGDPLDDEPAAPAPSTVPTDDTAAGLPEAMADQTVLDLVAEIGAPVPGAVVDPDLSVMPGEARYRIGADDRDASVAWIEGMVDRIGCTSESYTFTPASASLPEEQSSLSCLVRRDGQLLTVSVTGFFGGPRPEVWVAVMA